MMIHLQAWRSSPPSLYTVYSRFALGLPAYTVYHLQSALEPGVNYLTVVLTQ